MISLCLQACPLDEPAAVELTQLICDIEPERRENTEFFLVYRKDCHIKLGKHFEGMASLKFARAVARPARNHDVGWPGGPNMLAASAFMEIGLLRREGICKNDGFLLFEPDCLPMAKDWLNQLSDEWERTRMLGKEAFGHWHDLPDDGLHMNGNAVYMTAFYDMHPDMLVGSAMQGWDYFYRHKFLAISRDSDLIFQNWNRYGITKEELELITKNGKRPAFFHGIKTPDGRLAAREMLGLLQGTI